MGFSKENLEIIQKSILIASLSTSPINIPIFKNPIKEIDISLLVF